MNFFTADLHLGHGNIIRHCDRPFSTVEEMDAVIIDAINDTVGPRDTLWILGDFCHRGPAAYRDRILCRTVRLLFGNHDRRGKCEAAGFASVADVAEVRLGLQRVWLSHYPHRSWPASHRGSWHLYGHVHGTLADASPNSLDVGVDAVCDWSPWSEDELFEHYATMSSCSINAKQTKARPSSTSVPS